MELKDNIAFLKGLHDKLAAEVATEDDDLKEYLRIGRERMYQLDKKRERMYHIESAMNNLTALAEEQEEHKPVTEDPWA